jgi:hypothetical protein
MASLLLASPCLRPDEPIDDVRISRLCLCGGNGQPDGEGGNKGADHSRDPSEICRQQRRKGYEWRGRKTSCGHRDMKRGGSALIQNC